MIFLNDLLIKGCRVMCGKFKFLVWKTIQKIGHNQNMILLIECKMQKAALLVLYFILLLLHFILINVSNFDPQRNEIEGSKVVLHIQIFFLSVTLRSLAAKKANSCEIR